MKFIKLMIVFLLSVTLMMFAVQSASAGCEVLPGEDPVPLDPDAVGGLGLIKGIVVIHYETVPNSPESCDFLGPVANLKVFARLKGFDSEGKKVGKFVPFSEYFPYIWQVGEPYKTICFGDNSLQKKILMQWAEKEVVPFFFDNLTEGSYKVGLKNVKQLFQTEADDFPAFAVMNVVIAIDPIDPP